uniref:Uncharacterized protein n=1 Tax=Rangifer tarandus platyrhynchus TaxID=3082113 RepID=A0ACB0F788_RANTA|nr:unnamed protein product [Rangifer tarandus platyrhynchus]
MALVKGLEEGKGLIDNSTLGLYRPAPAPLAFLGRGGAQSRLKGTGAAGRGLEGDVQGPKERARGRWLRGTESGRSAERRGARGSSQGAPPRRPTRPAAGPLRTRGRRTQASLTGRCPALRMRDPPLRHRGVRGATAPCRPPVGGRSGGGSPGGGRSPRLGAPSCLLPVVTRLPEPLRASVFPVSKMGMISLFPSTE